MARTQRASRTRSTTASGTADRERLAGRWAFRWSGGVARGGRPAAGPRPGALAARRRHAGRARPGRRHAPWGRPPAGPPLPRPASDSGSGSGSGVSPSRGRRATGVGRDSRTGASAIEAARGASPRSSSSRIWSTRVPCSIDASSTTWSAGIRRRRSRTPSSRRTKPIARSRASSVSRRSAVSPMTLTQTFACERSRVVSTSVTVANPIRGSATSRARIAPISWRRSSSTRSVRWLMRRPYRRFERLTDCWVNASMMSPSARSWNPARPMPHS